MAEHDDGGPASEKSLLDWYAGQALTGLLAGDWTCEGGTKGSEHKHAVASHILAQAMIREKRRLEAAAEEKSDKGEG